MGHFLILHGDARRCAIRRTVAASTDIEGNSERLYSAALIEHSALIANAK
jgi:hypothetical protein